MSWESLVIEGDKICQQADEMINALEKDNENLQLVCENLSYVQTEDSLQGVSWTQEKEKSEAYTLILQGMICANECMISDSQKLKDMTGNMSFSGTAVSQLMAYENQTIATCESRLSSLRKVQKRLEQKKLSIWQTNRSISNTERMIGDARNVIQTCYSNIEQAEHLVSATLGLYREAEHLYQVVNQGLSYVNTGNYEALEDCGLTQFLMNEWDKLPKRLEIKYKEYLRQNGVTEQQLEFIPELGYSYEEIQKMWKNFPKDTDRQFLYDLLEGTEKGYKAAFSIDPDSLSDEMTLILADYAWRLFPEDLPADENNAMVKRLQEFNNAILSQDMHIRDSMGEITSVLYRDRYMERLCAGSIMQVNGDMLCLAAISPEDNLEAYTNLYLEYKRKFAVMNLWKIEDILIHEIEESGPALELKISGLNIVQNRIDFNFSYLKDGEIVTDTINTNMLEDGQGVLQTKDIEKREKLKEEQTKRIKSIILDWLQTAVDLALVEIAPELVLISNLAGMLMFEDNKELDGLPELSDDIYKKSGLSISQETINDIVGLYNAYKDFEKEEEETDLTGKMSWFGMGYRYKKDGKKEISSCGIYNPNVLRTLNNWSKDGIASWMEIEPETINEIKEDINNDKNLSEEEKNNMLILLDGGDIQSMGFGDFHNAIDNIEATGISIGSIKTKWDDYILEQNQKYSGVETGGL